jgi:hypothetical protein
MEWVWQFGLYPLDRQQTRLVSRGAERTPNTATFWLLMRVMEPASFVMTTKMLLNLKNRAERLYASGLARSIVPAISWVPPITWSACCAGSLNPVCPPEHFAEADGGEDLKFVRAAYPSRVSSIGSSWWLLRSEPQPGGIDAYLERPCPFAVCANSARAALDQRFRYNTKQDVAIVIVETDDGLTGYGEARAHRW